jgi:acyl-CoA hydrolase
MVEKKTTRFTIYTTPELIELTEQIADERGISRSKVVSQCLEELAYKRYQELLEEGYKAMAKENQEFAGITFEAQSQVIPDHERDVKADGD